VSIDLKDPKWRFKERVDRLVNKGHTQKEAEEIVERVIRTKEN
jgi:predicted Ser/Thr protein kinase